MSKYLSENDDFKDFIRITSDKIGLATGIVEKDYWVTRILRALSTSEFANEFLFKGGTSLSKVWFEDFGRFSEDIDILLLQTEQTVKRNDQSNRLSGLINLIAALKDISLVEEKSSSFEKNIIGGKFYYDYPSSFKESCPDCIKPEILIEPGYRGGSNPYSIKSVNSLLANAILKQFNDSVPLELDDYKTDILPFELKVLNPERIFLEKVDAIINLHKKNILESGTRHYYDIYNLIKLDAVKQLNTNQSELTMILNDISAISKKYYGVKESLTAESIKDCKAFSVDYEGFILLKKQYENEKGLYYKKQIDFEKMIKVIEDFIKNL
ncbi:MAG: nucleotidyl transferase AbiEii/AbiGii toxin family protein [Candidatus Gastranaerophilales bacterium]|nr:nucleotidyl transferase AbiEii/AbiGii toxin family protein [Candidatus Gastranaerophilales bacterium]